MTRRSLVTGGAGFMGSHLADELLRRGHEVVVLDDLSGGFASNVPAGAAFHEGSINNVDLVNRLFAQYRFDYVFHLAAYAAVGLSHFIRRYNYNNNLIGSINLINASVTHEIKCFVFTSSISVYGAAQVPMLESTTPIPDDPYGVAKYAVELDLLAARRLFGLNYIVFRPHNVYGERQNMGDKYRNVLGIFINSLLAERPMPIFGDGTQTRAFSYIGDVAPIIARSIDVDAACGETFNIGADETHTVAQLAGVVAAAMGRPCAVEHLPAREEVKHAFSDHSKARQILGAEPTTSLEEGVGRMVAWARTIGHKAGKDFAEIEVTKNMPSGWTAG